MRPTHAPARPLDRWDGVTPAILLPSALTSRLYFELPFRTIGLPELMD
jgi:hypothetical protein